MKKIMAFISSLTMMLFLSTSCCCNCNKHNNEDRQGCVSKCGKPYDDKRCKEDRKNGQRDGKFCDERGKCVNGKFKKCGDSPCPKMTAEKKEMMKKWENFDNLTPDEQKDLIKQRKQAIDQCEAERVAKVEARKAKREEIAAKWKKFDQLTVAEQKELIDLKSHKPFRNCKRKPFEGACNPQDCDFINDGDSDDATSDDGTNVE